MGYLYCGWDALCNLLCGKVRKDPTKSVVYDQYEQNREKYLSGADIEKQANLPGSKN